MVTGGEFQCPLCRVTYTSDTDFYEHKTTPEHRFKWLRHWYNSKRNFLSSNKEGVIINLSEDALNVKYEENTGTVSAIIHPGNNMTFSIIISNASDGNPVILMMIESLVPSQTVRLSDAHEVTSNNKFVRILPGVSYSVECHINATTTGIHSIPFVFQFKTEGSQAGPFYIVRTIEAMVIDNVAKDCMPTTPYEPIKVKYYSRHDRGTYEPGIPIEYGESRQVLPRKHKLDQYRYKGDLRNIAAVNFRPKADRFSKEIIDEATRLRNMMRAGLSINNYVEWFQTQLWLEEMQWELDIQYYSIPEARLKDVPLRVYSKTKCVELEVFGLAENRPSILKGDSVFVTHAGKKKPVFEGIVHQVNEKSVFLAFSANFLSSFVEGLKVSVEFSINRYPLRVAHRATKFVKDLFNLTFPTSAAVNRLAVSINITPFNRNIQQNPEQLEAVSNIVAGTSKPLPYIIFGPPGTGKTVTVVEAIKQIYKHQPKSHILAAAPSNSAADLIAKRLLEHVSKSHILRMHAQSRHMLTVPNELKEISNINGNEFYLVNDNELRSYNIIVCTFVTAARITSAQLPFGHITHIFLDECGHATEPECLSAVAGIVDGGAQVVLAGDPHQLGPVIRNLQCFSSGKLFKNNGLDKSYLERLMENKVYQPTEGKFNRQVVTKLLNNYRSHKDILKESNEMFYNGELKVCADPILSQSLCRWEHLAKPNFPLIFHAVRGKDEREGKSPSYFNTLEVSAVIDYTMKLMESRNPKIHGRDIGIITPYRRQVEKIRLQLSKLNLRTEIKVGSPEEFQGDERRVIIISTVRATTDKLAEDHVFRLGFLRNPKRFNVAVTRAKGLLVIIGCPEVLQLDEHWGKLLSFIVSRGGYKGQLPSNNASDLQEIINRFDQLSLRPTMAEEVSARELAEAPGWNVEC